MVEIAFLGHRRRGAGVDARHPAGNASRISGQADRGDRASAGLAHLVSGSESEWLYYIIDSLCKGQANLLVRSCSEAM